MKRLTSSCLHKLLSAIRHTTLIAVQIQKLLYYTGKHYQASDRQDSHKRLRLHGFWNRLGKTLVKRGKGVVKQCCYYDRKYKRQGIKVTPPLLTSCFFPYTHDGIINLLNYEICCDFTHMIVTGGMDADETPFCGAV